MTELLNWKRYQFVTEVQTALIGNAMRAALKGDKERDHFVSSTSMLNLMHTVFVAAEQIPENLSAHEAACEIVDVLLNVEERKLPVWFRRPEQNSSR